ncbi:MAG: hypothetical protein ACFFCP_09005, partial [Promethearchaeota archaeon]
MIQILEFDTIQASLIAIILPILAVCLFILILPTLRNGSNNKFRRYLSYLFSPPKLNSATPIEESTRNRLIQREDKIKLYFYYLGILLFLVTFMIGEFYQVMFDLLLPISQGTTGEVRVASVVAFQSIFSAGWIGTLPWLGQVAYHKTWEWIYFTAAFTDNLGFLSAVSV